EVLKSVGFENKLIIIRMRHVPFVDATGLHNFKGALKILKDSETKIILSGVNDAVCEDLKKSGIHEMVGQDNIFPSFDLALAAATDMITKTGFKRKSF
ncbi:MAG TPA: sodium-independent anion transporter, partial [Draconibacterium sp.]|nr:sodium-independent anion transporter [Draconibacterium sp.]